MLKSLELFGFKSFADRTIFEFSPGVTCVVGPNGSGKSNVVDSIKWILGDQSAKSLRGKEMTDVIFNGSAGRGPAGFAEASLRFDNSKGLLPVDSQEVSIGRRLWRNGDSEYLINGATARLRDIRDLFMGTGASTSAYSIIEQGRVEQILQANASTRRAVFEEAAGVSRYKARKAEALRKLERVSQNLLRLKDIVDEVEAQLHSTRNQAAKAAKYRDVAEELRAVWLGLAADDFRYLSVELEEAEGAIAEYEAENDELNQRQTALESRLAAFDAETAHIDHQLREVESRVAANREEIAGHKATIRHQVSRQQELETDLERLRRQRYSMQKRLGEAAAESNTAREQVDRFEETYSKQVEQLEGRELRIKEISEELRKVKGDIEEKRQTVLQIMRQISEATHRVASLHSQLESARAARSGAVERLGGIERDIESCQRECDRREERVATARREEIQASTTAAKLQDKHDALIDSLDASQQQLATYREQRSASRARQTVLQDLENRQEGFGIGVREILQRSKQLNSAPWNSVLGTVADLLDVDLEDAALLDVALGERSQYLILDDPTPLIDYLNNGTYEIAGRVNFLPLAATMAGSIDDPSTTLLPDLQSERGVVRRADELAECTSPAAPSLATQLLADTWIVETLAIATHLARGKGRGCRFVTLQGELLEADGTIVIGTVHRENAIVSRKSELRRLKQDLSRLDQSIQAEEKKLAEADESIGELAEALQTAHEKRRAATETLSRLTADLQSQTQAMQRLQSEKQAIEEEQTQRENDEQRLEEELLTAQREATETESHLTDVQTTIQQLEKHLSDLGQLQLTEEAQQNAEKLRMAKEEERLAVLRENFERMDAECRLRADQAAESERRYQAVVKKQRQSRLNILNTNAILAELAVRVETLEQEVANVERQKDQFRGERAELNEEDASIRQARRQLSEKQHAQEMRLRDLKHQIAMHEERIEEEFQVSLADVVASGVSAFNDYLEEKYGSDQPAMTESTDDTATEDDAPASSDNVPLDLDDPESGEPETDAMSPTAQGNTRIRFEEVRDEIEARVKRLQRKRKLMGNVNTDSLRDLDELEKRYERLNAQLLDLEEAKATLEQIVGRINNESRRLFSESFESIRGHFQELFRKLFGGGDADIVLEDPNDILECGIDIVARPPGKELRSITLLSGGEKTMTAVAMLMAIFKSRPSPFCVLDEVDAALDEANVERYTNVVQSMQDSTQFIMITHNKRSMTAADIMYGVTMEQSGVSKRMAVRFEDVSEDGHIRTAHDGQDRATSDAA